MSLNILQRMVRPIFGHFETEEFKKFIRMGLIFACIIGAYWTLRTLKNATFSAMVGAASLPYAKTISIFLLIPLVMFYTKLLDNLSRERMFYTLSIIYGIGTLLFTLLLINPNCGQATCDIIASRTGFSYWLTKIVAYTLYIFVESYGSLVVALFWAIASDTTSPDSAKKGFGFVVAIGQLGGIVGPLFLTKLPRWFNFSTNALSVFACGIITLVLIPYFFRLFLTKTPKNLLTSFHGKNEAEEEKEQEPGFFEGLKLLLQHKYLLGMFAVISFPEILTTIFDLHFQTLAATHYSGTALSEYLGLYGGSVNFIALMCLLLGVNNIARLLGIGVALALMPVCFAFAMLGFLSLNSLTFLFILMAGSKALNYALNGPAIKQLYIPTTHDVRFKSQAWMETFGSRGSKEAGSLFNMLLLPFQTRYGIAAGRAMHATIASGLGFVLVIFWFFIALFLGRTYKRAIDNKKVVC